MCVSPVGAIHESSRWGESTIALVGNPWIAPTGVSWRLVSCAYDPDKHHRRSIRLLAYDYSRPGSYYVTLCTHEKEHLFGQIVEGEMVLNETGRRVRHAWSELFRFPGIVVEEFIAMPNHLHGAIHEFSLAGRSCCESKGDS